MSTISERVARGAELLDGLEPEWFNDIDLDGILLTSPCECILGQLFGNFWNAVRDYNIGDYGRRHGFNARSAEFIGPEDREYDELTAEWRRVITERRAAA